jgi:hypothetical protein
MCQIGSCKAKQGMCGHEKMMLLVVMLIAAGAAGHWLLHLF